MDYMKLSKEISFALRHKPWQYELELDREGFVPIDQFLFALNETKHYPKQIEKEDLFKVIEISEKKRLEIKDGKIRALYGHTIPMLIEKDPMSPPELLYHGTSHNVLDSILKAGLQQMKRQYVHLSMDIETAEQVGKRRDTNPVILVIYAQKADKNGIRFYKGNDKVWLSNPIPPQYIEILRK